MIAALARLTYAMLTNPVLSYALEPGGPRFGLPKANVLPNPPRFGGHERAPNPLVLYGIGSSGSSFLAGAGDRVVPIRILVETTSIGMTLALAEAVRTRLVERSDPYDHPYPDWLYGEGIVVQSISEPSITEPALDLTSQRYFTMLAFVLIAIENGCPPVPKHLSALGV